MSLVPMGSGVAYFRRGVDENGRAKVDRFAGRRQRRLALWPTSLREAIFTRVGRRISQASRLR